MDKARKIVVKDVVIRLIKGEDYRIVTQTEINTRFLDYCIKFFKRIVDAKLEGETITEDWYKDNFVMNKHYKPVDRAIFSGINDKTIKNMYNSGTKEIVISASEENYDKLVEAISELVDENSDLDITLSIKFKNISIDLNLNESLVVVTSLAVKRAAITGGAYSSVGKNVEAPLMLTLCKLFNVSEDNYCLKLENEAEIDEKDLPTFEREIDFYLLSDENVHKCEVKLMGKGNPESADAVIARDSSVFVANTLSDTNKNQLNSLGVNWVELRSENGYKRFKLTLDNLNIPYTDNKYNLEEDLENIIDDILDL